MQKENYWGIKCRVKTKILEISNDFQDFLIGRSVGIRTRGLLDPNQARYQTSPHLDSLAIIMKKPGSVKPLEPLFLKSGELPIPLHHNMEERRVGVLKEIVEYPTWRETQRQKKKKQCVLACAALLMLVAAALLRVLFTKYCLSNWEVLDCLAYAVQNGELGLGEAVEVFCREVILSGA